MTTEEVILLERIIPWEFWAEACYAKSEDGNTFEPFNHPVFARELKQGLTYLKRNHPDIFKYDLYDYEIRGAVMPESQEHPQHGLKARAIIFYIPERTS